MLFERADVKRWRRIVHKELKRARMPSNDPTYPAAMVCAAVYCFGTNRAVLLEVSGVEEAIVTATLKRLRKERVLSGQTLHAGWNDKKHGWMAWFLDAVVGSGDLVRPVDPQRSAAHKGKHGGPRKPRRVVPPPNEPQAPKMINSDPKYWLANRPLPVGAPEEA